jgi:uncharacterized protein YbjT (DUF2867 family)
MGQAGPETVPRGPPISGPSPRALTAGESTPDESATGHETPVCGNPSDGCPCSSAASRRIEATTDRRGDRCAFCHGVDAVLFREKVRTMAGQDRVVVVTGATGRQGGATARHLLAGGWRVRAVTRSADSKAARRLAALGAEIVQADMASADEMRKACAGAHGVFSVQNAMTSGEQGELAQGKNAADAAADSGVAHLVYGSAGPGTPGTGVAAWDVKLDVADHARSIGLPLTVLRPMAFMELMTDKDLYPAVAAWHLMPRIVGIDRPIPWLSAEDLGVVAARAFGDPGSYIGLDVGLAADVRTLGECREIWRRVTARSPRAFPMPVWLFQRFVGPDLTRMWRWLASHDIAVDVSETRAHHPSAMTVEQFLRRATDHAA